MTSLRIGHAGLPVRNLEEEIHFLELLGATVTSIDRLARGRVAFSSTILTESALKSSLNR
jgi:hypothetical protein